CLDTRDEVLKRESLSSASGGECDVAEGEWYSYYDGQTWTSDNDLDIDHVALGEAWDSDARTWSPATRQAYANDLGDERTLVAVTDNVNQSKSDQDIAEWVPQLEVCRYASEWVAVKIRWQMSIDPAEKQVLETLADQCTDATVAPERVHQIGHGPPPEDEQPTAPLTGDGGYLFPAPPPDLDCSAIDARGFQVRPGDPHRSGNR